MNSDLPKRKSPRLSGYDYSKDGNYFVTICIQNRINALSELENGHFKLTECGKIIKAHMSMLNKHFSNAKISTFVIMPNHIHFIISLNSYGFDSCGKPIGRENPAPTQSVNSLTTIIAWFKYETTKQINQNWNNGYQKIWQRSFCDRVIRSKSEYLIIKEYILKNPDNWKKVYQDDEIENLLLN